MSYGTCSECKRHFHTSHDFDMHQCMQEAMKLSHEELEAKLIASGKLKARKTK